MDILKAIEEKTGVRIELIVPPVAKRLPTSHSC